MTATATPSKLPLWRTIGQAYAAWVRNFPDLVRTCWLWMLLTAPVLAIWMWWEQRHVTDIMHAGHPFADSSPLLTMVMRIARRVIILPALASVAVAWHRLLLRDEYPGPGVYLRLDRTVAGYAILAFWIAVITLAPSYLRWMYEVRWMSRIVAGTSASNRDMAVILLASLGSVIASLIAARLSLALPGIALGRDDVTFGTAWRASRRNTWRMFWAYFFCILPWTVILAWIPLWRLFSRSTVALVSLAMGLLWIPGGMISVGMLSLAYRHFFERRA